MKNMFTQPLTIYRGEASISPSCREADELRMSAFAGDYRRTEPDVLAGFVRDALSTLDRENRFSLLRDVTMPFEARADMMWQAAYAITAAGIWLMNQAPERMDAGMRKALSAMMSEAFAHGILIHGHDDEGRRLKILTTLGAAGVLFMKQVLSDRLRRALTGFAAGVMVAASVWSLLIPAIEQSAELGRWAFFPAAAGFWAGILFLLALDHIVPHLHVNGAEGPHSSLQRTTMMVLAVTIHNIPEGMAVGVVYAGFLSGGAQITAAGALALSLGIAIQNFPEGAIISMPLRAEGTGKWRAFAGGVLSGVVEPIGAALTILAARQVVPALPYLLSFAAGAMLYVVVEELIPEASQGAHSNLGTLFFAVGFSVMMVLDVALG